MLFREKNDKAVLESIMGVMRQNAQVANEQAKKNSEYLSRTTYAGLNPTQKTVKEETEVAAEPEVSVFSEEEVARIVEAAQLAEISNQAKQEYVKSASLDVARLGNTLGRLQAGKASDKLQKAVGDKITNRVKGMSRAVDTIKAEEVELGEATIGDDHIHVSDAGGGKYKVHAVGKNFANGIKVGEHLSDTELDDFSDMGGKVKTVKAPKPMKEQKSLSEILDEARGRPRKDGSPAGSKPAKAKSDEDDEDDYGPDTGPEADQNIMVHLGKSVDTEGGHDVKFSDGSSHKVPAHVAHKVLGAMHKLKPADRAKVQSHIQQSHKNLMDVHKMVS